MKRRGFIGILLVMIVWTLGTGSSIQAKDNPYTATVDVESAFVRGAPGFDQPLVASVFQDSRLEVVSRNLDGLWFEVKRPGRLTNLGWIFHEMLDYDFQAEYLPLGDLVTGVTGPKPLTEAPPYAAYLIQGPTLRDRPTSQGKRIMDIEPLLTVPVLERNQDGTWLHINYLGNDGWINSINVRPLPNVMDIPEAPGLPPLRTIAVVIIPVEIQQAQIDRMRAFIIPRRVLAANLETFWWSVFRGEIMPCDAPVELTYYPYSDEDVRELPELQRYAPRVATAIDDLNSAREPLLSCGVITPETVGNSRDFSINARIIFDATLASLDDLEKNVVQARR